MPDLGKAALARAQADSTQIAANTAMAATIAANASAAQTAANGASSAAARLGNAAGRFDGWSLISNRVIRPIAQTASGAVRSSRIALYMPFNAAAIRIGVENAGTGNAPTLSNSNNVMWRAALECVNVPLASAAGANVAPSSAAVKIPAFFGGKAQIEQQPDAFGFSDPVRAPFQAGTVVFIDSACQPSAAPAPAAPTVAAAAGGNVPAATYQVGITLVYGDGSESGCSAASAVTTASANLSVLVTAPAAASYPGARAWRVWISQAGLTTPLYTTATGDVPMGSNVTVSNLPNFAGVGATNLRQVVPGGTLNLPTGGYIGGGTASGACNNGETLTTLADITQMGFTASATTTTSAVGPFAVLAKDPTGKVWPSVAILDDSISVGTGDTFLAANVGGALMRTVLGHTTQRVYGPTVAPLCGHVCVGVPGQTIAQVVGGAGRVAIQKAMLATHVYANGGTNDLFGATSAAALIALKLQEALVFTLNGRRFRPGTVLPRTASSDGWQTVAGQSMPVGTGTALFAGYRAQYNNVLRSGAAGTGAVSGEAMFRNDATMTPATSFFSGGNGGTVSFCTAYPFVVGSETIRVGGVSKAAGSDYSYLGQATINGVSHASGVTFATAPAGGAAVTAAYTRCAGFVALVGAAEVLAGAAAALGLTVVLDPAAAVEANGSGVATLGGHWWQGPAGATVGSGTVGSGATTSSITGSGWTQDQWRGFMFIDVTTGWTGTITGNTATQLNFMTLTGVPAASDSYVIARTLTWDGSHPSPDGCIQLAPVYLAQVTADIAAGV